MVLRIPRIQPIGAVISSDTAGRMEWYAASAMNPAFHPGVAVL